MRVELNPHFVSVTNQRNGNSLGCRIRVAADAESRTVGLLNTPGLDVGEGLWIFPCRSIHMQGMRFPIEALWLDPDCVVIGLDEALWPGDGVRRVDGALSVLELPVGTVSRTDTELGDRLLIQQVSGS